MFLSLCNSRKHLAVFIKKLVGCIWDTEERIEWGMFSVKMGQCAVCFTNRYTSWNGNCRYMRYGRIGKKYFINF